MIELEEFELPR